MSILERIDQIENEEELEQVLEAVKVKLDELESAVEPTEGEDPAEVEVDPAVAEIVEQLANDVDELAEVTEKVESKRSMIREKRQAAIELRNRIAAGAGNTIKSFEKKEEVRKMYGVDSIEYRNAWLKHLMGKELTVEERSNTGIDSATLSGGYAIPTTTLDKIIENMVQVAPMIAEIDLMHIPGNITIAVEGTRNAATIHTENAAITAQDDTLVHIALSGYEIVKLVPVSAKLSTMSIDAFETWIVSNLSRSVAEVVENYIINGDGSGEPSGIDNQTWSDGTNAVDFASSAPTVAEIEELIGYQNAAYIGNAKFLMNWKTFWTQIHVLRDDKNEPVCTRDNGVNYIFGFPVVFSSKVTDGDIFFGDFREGVKGNFAQDVTVDADRSSGFRYNAIDYRGVCIFDCAPVAGRIVKGAASL